MARRRLRQFADIQLMRPGNVSARFTNPGPDPRDSQPRPADRQMQAVQQIEQIPDQMQQYLPGTLGMPGMTHNMMAGMVPPLPTQPPSGMQPPQTAVDSAIASLLMQGQQQMQQQPGLIGNRVHAAATGGRFRRRVGFGPGARLGMLAEQIGLTGQPDVNFNDQVEDMTGMTPEEFNAQLRRRHIDRIRQTGVRGSGPGMSANVWDDPAAALEGLATPTELGPNDQIMVGEEGPEIVDVEPDGTVAVTPLSAADRVAQRRNRRTQNLPPVDGDVPMMDETLVGQAIPVDELVSMSPEERAFLRRQEEMAAADQTRERFAEQDAMFAERERLQQEQDDFEQDRFQGLGSAAPGAGNLFEQIMRGEVHLSAVNDPSTPPSVRRQFTGAEGHRLRQRALAAWQEANRPSVDPERLQAAQDDLMRSRRVGETDEEFQQRLTENGIPADEAQRLVSEQDFIERDTRTPMEKREAINEKRKAAGLETLEERAAKRQAAQDRADEVLRQQHEDRRSAAREAREARRLGMSPREYRQFQMQEETQGRLLDIEEQRAQAELIGAMTNRRGQLDFNKILSSGDGITNMLLLIEGARQGSVPFEMLPFELQQAIQSAEAMGGGETEPLTPEEQELLDTMQITDAVVSMAQSSGTTNPSASMKIFAQLMKLWALRDVRRNTQPQGDTTE